MFTLAMIFRSENKEKWMFVTNEATFDKTSISPEDVYYLSEDSTDAEVFRTMEDILAIQGHIVRVLNRRHETGEKFDIDFEHTGLIGKYVNKLLKKNRNTAISFKYFELQPTPLGEVSFSIRSDIRF